MRVLISGATGFIGMALCRELLQAGHEVVALSRNPSKAETLLPREVRAVGWGLPEFQGWIHHGEGDYAIINLAGENLSSGYWTKTRKKGILQSRLTAGEAMVAGLERTERKPRVVIQASAVGYYGPGKDEVDESSPPGEGFLSLVCQEWEGSTVTLGSLNIRRIVIRSGVVLGREGGALPRFVFPFRLFVGGPLGTGEQWLSWIHLRDEVRAIRFLLERPDLRGSFNLTAPIPLQEKEFCRVLGAVLHRPCWLPVPGFALRLVFGGMADEMLLAGQRVLPKRLLESGFSFLYPDVVPALHTLLG